MALIFHSVIFDLLSIVIAFLVIIYIYFTWNFNYWKKRGVPFLKPTPFVGNFGKWMSLKMNVGLMFEKIYEDSKNHSFVGIWVFRKPALVINSPEIIKAVLAKDFSHFADRTTFSDKSYDPLGADTLFFGKNPYWKHMRVKLTPLFSSSKMRTMFDLMNEVGLEFVEYIDENLEKTMEVKDTMGKYITEVIASTAFGLKANSIKDPDSMFNTFRRKITQFDFIRTIQFMAMFFYQELAKFLRASVFGSESEEWLRSVFWKTVEERERTKENRNDLIGTLIAIKNQPQSDNISFTEDSLVAQVGSFYLAGNETSSLAMAFLLYELAINPDTQDKLSAEISHVLSKYDNKVTYEGMQEMSYLDMCFKETLRLHTPLGFLDRRCTVPYKLPGTDLVLPVGSMVYIPVTGLHMDPDYFEDPTVFKPERFDKENSAPIKPYTFMPFGEGPRVCIGERYGTLLSKIGLVHVLKKYHVRPSSLTQVPLILLKYTLSPTARDGIHVKFVPK